MSLNLWWPARNNVKLSKRQLVPIKGDSKPLVTISKEKYEWLQTYRKVNKPDKDFNKLSLENKILKLHLQLIEAAKQAGVTLLVTKSSSPLPQAKMVIITIAIYRHLFDV